VLPRPLAGLGGGRGRGKNGNGEEGRVKERKGMEEPLN